METKPERIRSPRFDLTAGNLCLDFINTLDNRPTEPNELLKSFLDLARFGEDTGILTPAQADSFIERSQAMPTAAEQTLRSAIEMREAMFAVFSAVVNKQPVPKDALAKLNGSIQYAAQHTQLVPANGGFAWEFDRIPSPERCLDPMLWPITRATADLLASSQLPFVRACSSPTCEWLFLDTSKNHRRRWCSMKQCGNRAKVRRFYAKKRAV